MERERKATSRIESHWVEEGRSVAEQLVTSPSDVTRRLTEEPSFATVVESLRAGRGATIDGAWASSKSLSLAALARDAASTLVVVVPHPSDIDPLIVDLRTFGVDPIAVLPALEDRLAGREGATLSARESAGARLAVVKALLSPEPPRLVLATMAALLQPVPTPDRLAKASRTLEVGKPIDLPGLTRWLTRNGWRPCDAVELPGEFSTRGGILDLFPLDARDPLRIELFGDDVESIREFSVESQRSLRVIDRADITLLDGEDGNKDRLDDASAAHIADIVPKGAWFALLEPTELKSEGKQYLARLETPAGLFSVEASWTRLIAHPTVVITALPFASLETSCRLQVESVERFSGDVNKVREELDRTVVDEDVLLFCHNQAEIERLREVLRSSQIAKEGRLTLLEGRLARGFRWLTAHLLLLSDHELFNRAEVSRLGPRRRHQSRAIDSFLDLADGDYVVHLGHGIGIYRGMRMLDKNDQLEEHLTIEFADQVLVYVPASKIDLVQKYVGGSQTTPRLSKVGGVSWEKRKRAAQLAVRDLASELLEIQAARQARPGSAFPPDSEWQREFEAAFPWEETPDQLTSMVEIRHDMEQPRPMDRLLCGDVGYGKTELAMRAAFKAVDFGKQVALLVPTTILAQQHVRTFRARMAEFPFVIEVISRFESKGQQRAILKKAKEGAVDILIGTHRLLSADVAFQDLGLVVIDEEQRFGVEHKERLKRLREQVDVLTMSATPIPRTLHSALLGIRDISNLETPPPNRLSVETRIHRWDPTLLRHAILRELNRDGQIYFVHNRVSDIQLVAQRLLQVVPEVRIAIIHGQMSEDKIEEGMLAFLQRRADLLLATTIIESGLDIPNANTIFINEGDHHGLADMHQLRGRVGRGSNRAYCYVLVEEHKTLRPEAQRRLKAIEEYSQLGSGFQIALRDLEIRGAGNILGAEQSGHIAAVGYELYCQLLDTASRQLKKLPIRTHDDVTIELPWQAYFPANYLPAERQRIDVYRRLARSERLDDLDEFRRELVDRFGPLPQQAEHFLDLAELRLLAQIWQIESVRPNDDGFLVIHYRQRRRLETLEKLRNGSIKIVDPKSAFVFVRSEDRTAQGYARILKQLLQPN